MKLCKALIILALYTGPAVAQDTLDPLSKWVEGIAHQRLERMRLAPKATMVPFTTDGCSGGMSATWDIVARLFPEFREIHETTPPWQECCVVHDRAYHQGGDNSAPQSSFAARLAADEALRICVRASSQTRRVQLKSQYEITDERIDQAFDLIGDGMFDAVRVGGGPCSGLAWRWGYGWPHCGIFSNW